MASDTIKSIEANCKKKTKRRFCRVLAFASRASRVWRVQTACESLKTIGKIDSASSILSCATSSSSSQQFQLEDSSKKLQQDSSSNGRQNDTCKQYYRNLSCAQQLQEAAAVIQVTKLNINQTTSNNFDNSNNNELIKQIENNDPNVDGGYAWIILMTMFTINASTFGAHRAYGLIFERLARNGLQTRAEASLPFTIMGAVENMGGLLTGYLISQTSWRVTVFLGSCLITSAHFLAALSTSPLASIASMGLINGAGLSLVAISSFQINNAYFLRYRSTAFGLSLTGAAFGALFISPLCQFVLQKYNDDSRVCYFLLSAILAPNVPLSLLLKPKPLIENESQKTKSQIHDDNIIIKHQQNLNVADAETNTSSTFWQSVVKVLRTPMFHLIWPMQLLYCWLNFVYGVIIVDFGKDRGLQTSVASSLVMFWALGQLVGRVALSSLVDNTNRFLSLRWLTVLNMAVVALLTCSINNVQSQDAHTDIQISTLTFLLSIFIANQFILFNGLVVTYMQPNLSAMSIGISSFIGSFLLLPRASVIGYFRDSFGNYDSMLAVFAVVLTLSALAWLALPPLFDQLINNRTTISLSSSSTSITSLQIKCQLQDPTQKKKTIFTMS